MTLATFEILDTVNQHEEVCTNGELIAQRIEGSSRIELWQIGSFYVEVSYTTELNVLNKLKSFNTIDLPDEYTRQFDMANT